MMDAVKFVNEAMRMCSGYWSKCWACPAGDDVSCKLSSDYCRISAEEKVDIVEQWAKRHPDDAPEEIKRQILANDRALKERDSSRSKSDTGR